MTTRALCEMCVAGAAVAAAWWLYHYHRPTVIVVEQPAATGDYAWLN